MKQILLVLVLLATALIGFVAVRTLNNPTTARPGGGGTSPSAPNITLPGQGTQRAGQQRNSGVRPGRPNTTTRLVQWKAMASPESIVAWDDLWSLDLDAIDLTAPVLVEIGDLKITQNELRRMACLEVLETYNLAVLTEEVAKALSFARGNPYEFDEAMYEELVERQTTLAGLSREERGSQLAMQTRTPPEVAEETHRRMLAGLIYNVVGGAVDELPAMILLNMQRSNPRGPDGENVEIEGGKGAMGTLVQLRETWNRIHSTDDYEDRDEDLDKLSGIVSLQAAFQQGARNRDLGLRCWTFLDRAAMDDDVYMRISLAPLDDEEVPVAPWLHGGDTIDLHVSEMWPRISELIDDAQLRLSLVNLVWYRVLGERLREAGLLGTDEEDFQRAAESHLELMGALNDTVFTSQSQGFPTVHHYRAAQRLMRGQRALLPSGWDDEAVQRPFFNKNRFFIERWNPQLEFAYFPALDITATAEGQGWKVNWEGALEKARTMKGRVALGQDFRQLVRAHTEELSTTMSEAFGTELGKEYAQRLRGGLMVGTLRDVESRMGETDFNELIRGTSFVKCLAAYTEVGEVSEPRRISGGYALGRMASAELGALERDWEDSTVVCEFFYLRSEFLKWANGALRDAPFVYP
jgi:hypothetical protein